MLLNTYQWRDVRLSRHASHGLGSCSPKPSPRKINTWTSIRQSFDNATFQTLHIHSMSLHRCKYSIISVTIEFINKARHTSRRRRGGTNVWPARPAIKLQLISTRAPFILRRLPRNTVPEMCARRDRDMVLSKLLVWGSKQHREKWRKQVTLYWQQWSWLVAPEVFRDMLIFQNYQMYAIMLPMSYLRCSAICFFRRTTFIWPWSWLTYLSRGTVHPQLRIL